MKMLFKNKVFRIIMLTDIIQQMCIWIRNITILFYVVEKTNSDPIAISLITVFEYLPMFVFSYIGGTLADRWNPKKTMIIGDLLSSLSLFLILILVNNGLWQAVFATTLMSSVITQFSVPSSTIMFKKNIPNNLLTSAISCSQSLISLYIIIGPIIGTIFYSKFEIQYTLIIISLLFLISSIIQFKLPSSPKVQQSIKKRLLNEMKEGIIYIKKSKYLKILSLILTLFGLAQGLIQPLTIYILSDRLEIKIDNLQWFYALSGFGLFIGAVLCAGIINKLKIKFVLFFSVIAFSFITVMIVLSEYIYLTAILYLLSGINTAFIQIAVSSPLVKNVSETYIGRINGLITPLLTGGVLVGSGLSGILFKQFNLSTAFFISSGIMIICGLMSLSYPEE